MLAVVSGAQDSHKFMSGIIAGIMIARRSTVAVPIGSFGGRVSLLHVPATAITTIIRGSVRGQLESPPTANGSSS